MNTDSLRRIEEVIKVSGKWSSLEISHNSIYLEFLDVELGNPEVDDKLEISIRFADDFFVMFFYDNIWNLEFFSNFDYDNFSFFESFEFEVLDLKFLDFGYLEYILNKYKKSKLFTELQNFDIRNIRNDFFLIFETKNFAVAFGGNQMDFFDKFEKLDDYSLKELSNQWTMYFLNYNSKRNIINKDSVCENSILK